MAKNATSRVIPIQAQAPDGPDGLFSAYEKQTRIYPRAVRGWFATWRWIMVGLTQAVFYGLPWLQWNGRQAVLFDLSERRFFVFGLVLHPQDFIYLAALLVISALALFFFTAVAGRLWCGYACPQTVYTEIFLWIERHIEGDRSARMRLDAAPWSMEKLLRKGGKQIAWMCGGPVHRFQLRRLFHADSHPGGRGGTAVVLTLGMVLGACSTGLPPTATPATCASRCANTCAPMRASRVR